MTSFWFSVRTTNGEGMFVAMSIDAWRRWDKLAKLSGLKLFMWVTNKFIVQQNINNLKKKRIADFGGPDIHGKTLIVGKIFRHSPRGAKRRLGN